MASRISYDPLPPPSAEVLALVAAEEQSRTARAEAKAEVRLQAIAAMTPAEVKAWVQANVNSLADAKDLLKTLAVAVSVLAKRL